MLEQFVSFSFFCASHSLLEIKERKFEVKTEINMAELVKQGCAASGAMTFDADHNMVECRKCGTKIRHDLSDHPFFGFRAGCPFRDVIED